MRDEFEQKQVACRKLIPEARSEDLLEFFEKTHWLLAQRAITARILARAEPDTVEQQYRLTAFAAKQELLKRLRVS